MQSEKPAAHSTAMRRPVLRWRVSEPASPAWRVGQAMDLRIELGGASNVLMLPNGPFYQDSGGNWVFVLTPDGRSAIKRTVRLGRRNPQFVEIVDGLSANEKVIVSGYEAFQKMDRVEFDPDTDK